MTHEKLGEALGEAFKKALKGCVVEVNLRISISATGEDAIKPAQGAKPTSDLTDVIINELGRRGLKI